MIKVPYEGGELSINSENILPIIKKWLYSDKDIFIREMVSNACDAVNKFKKLVSIGEASAIEDEKYYVKVIVNEKEGSIQIVDNGIGMTNDDVKQYINQIAFSGAKDFLSKYEEKISKDNEIIGHFGLGFYSAFMVSDKVTIDTLSYTDGATPVKWWSDGGTQYEMDEGERTERGTTITLHLQPEEDEFLKEYRVKQVLDKYCAFMPVEIYLETVHEDDEEKEDKIIDSEAVSEEAQEEETKEEKEPEIPKPINDTNPLWVRQPKDCTDEEYKEFYKKVFMDFNEPLFWIHLNMDYPLRLKGILYFPKLKSDLEVMEGQVKLYNNQVFVADNIKEVIPEFLLLLKGVMDCPDLPLNVSRSFLQNDGYANKMSSYIIKKVADKLNNIYKNEKENFEKFWDDISLFIKYGCLKESTNFYDKVKNIILYKTIYGQYVTLDQYLTGDYDMTGEQTKKSEETENSGMNADENQQEENATVEEPQETKDETIAEEKSESSSKKKTKVYYVSDLIQQTQYIKMFKDNGLDAIVLNTNIDNPFISFVEVYVRGVTFTRIDAGIDEALKHDDDTEENEEARANQRREIHDMFRTALNKDILKLNFEKLKTKNISGIIILDEHSRRMKEMQHMFPGMEKEIGEPEETLILNENNNLVKNLISIKEDESKKEEIDIICKQIYDLALLGQQGFNEQKMADFIERSNMILERIVL